MLIQAVVSVLSDMIGLIVLIAYLVIYIARYGIPEHISATYEKFGVWFTIALWVVAMDWGIAFIERGYGLLAFILMGAIMMVGATPMLTEKTEWAIHRISASIAMLASVALMVVANPISLASFGITLLSVRYRKSWLFFAELACFVGVFISLTYCPNSVTLSEL